MSDQVKRPVFDRAIALLQDFEESQPVWMFRTLPAEHGDSDQVSLELFWADRLEKESYREAIARELDWQFDLNRKKDYIVCSTPRISLIVHPERMEVISRADAVEQGFGVLEVYPIQLFGRHSRQHLIDRDDVRFERLPGLRQADHFTRQTRLLLEWLDVAGTE